MEITDDRGGLYTKNDQIIFKTAMLNPILCDYSYRYMLVKGAISVT